MAIKKTSKESLTAAELKEIKKHLEEMNMLYISKDILYVSEQKSCSAAFY